MANLPNRNVMFTLSGQLFVWDSEKYDINMVKHNITFEEAASVFLDPMTIYRPDDEHSEDEEREIVIGFSNMARILFVCSCEREYGDIIRIISARKATSSERAEWRKENDED